jgi:hypothetical protein
MIAAAVVPLLAAWVLASSRRGRMIAASIDALAMLSTAIFWNAPYASSFGLFLGASIFAALAFAALSPEQELDGLARLHLGASFALVAAAADDLWWSLPAVLLSGLVVQPSAKRFHLFILPNAAALSGLVPGIGAVPLVLGLWTGWLVASREVLRSTATGLVTRMAACYVLLVAVCAVVFRLPTGAPVLLLAIGFLGLGALGAFGSTRVTTFSTSILLARAGFLLLAELGGILGRSPALVGLLSSGISLLLLAAALAETETLDEVSSFGSLSRRLVLSLAALSLASFPPFPGFLALFPLASAVAERGHELLLLAAAGLWLLLVLGSMRLVTRSFGGGGARSVETGIGRPAMVLALFALLAFAVAPAVLVDAARAAALALP